MMKETTKKNFRILDNVICFFFSFMIQLANAIIFIFLIFGAGASMILLYKLYPSIFIRLFIPMSLIFFLMLKILLVIAIGTLILASAKVIIDFYYYQKERRIKRRDEFINELAQKLKLNLNLNNKKKNANSN